MRRQNVAVAAANTAKAKAAQAQTKADYERNVGPDRKSGAVSQQAFELAKANSERAPTRRVGSGRLRRSWQARATSGARRNAPPCRWAQTNLNYTTIRAPIDGNGGGPQRGCRPDGRRIPCRRRRCSRSRRTSPKCRSTRKPMSPTWGRNEARPKKSPSKSTPNPRENLFFRHGLAGQDEFPTVVQNVVTYDTIIEFDNPRSETFPGHDPRMSAFRWRRSTTSSKFPNAALRFKT